MVALIGGSGSGKSTLMQHLSAAPMVRRARCASQTPLSTGSLRRKTPAKTNIEEIARAYVRLAVLRGEKLPLKLPVFAAGVRAVFETKHLGVGVSRKSKGPRKCATSKSY